MSQSKNLNVIFHGGKKQYQKNIVVILVAAMSPFFAASPSQPWDWDFPVPVFSDPADTSET